MMLHLRVFVHITNIIPSFFYAVHSEAQGCVSKKSYEVSSDGLALLFKYVKYYDDANIKEFVFSRDIERREETVLAKT